MGAYVHIVNYNIQNAANYPISSESSNRIFSDI